MGLKKQEWPTLSHTGNCTQPNFEKQDGLLPVIVQEYKEDRSGRVLMLAYVSKKAYDLTRYTGFAHFWSRSRQQLWKKGETSGNFLPVREIWVDCDNDTLLYLVTSPGIVCHLNRSDCFFENAKEVSSERNVDLMRSW
ncbi:MAG: phosphoribosyl-AMP cyclohydrolase [Candidatus Parcubacteria bacterium]|nr:phosphoribosyl-AMP cyclohydrolase [Candidatus Parcubacteria bacterium]